MKIIPELKKIACLNSKIDYLAGVLRKSAYVEELEIGDALDLRSAMIVSGLHVEKGHLYNKNGCRLDNAGLVDDLYYCWQCAGCCEDDYYGILYFKTDVPGQYVAVPFDT